MSLFSIIGAVGGIAGSIAGNIVNAVSSIGPALASFAAKVAPIVNAVISTMKEMVGPLLKFADNFLRTLNIIKPDETTEEFGERALQAAEKGITTDKFDNFDDYIESLRNFDLDPDKAQKRNQAEKLVAGMGVANVALEHKFNAASGSFDGIWLLPIANPNYFTPERMISLVSNGQLFGDILAYLDKRLSAGDSARLEESMAAGAGDKQELYKALDQTRENWEALKQKIEGDKEA